MKQPIDLRPDHAKIVHEIIARHLPAGVSVRVFGSRAKWTAKPHSDLDLALKGKEPLPRSMLGDLAEAFSESDLPFRVDVVDWHTVAPSFQAVIDRDGIALPWPIRTLGEFVKAREVQLQTGPFGSQLHAYDYQPDGVAVVPTEGIKNRRIDHSVLPKISHEKADELKRHRLVEGDILFARRGVQATGHTAMIRRSEVGFICGTGAIRLRIRENSDELHAPFLAQLLSLDTSVEWFKFHAIGATMPNLNEGIISSFSFPVPVIAEQRAIASVVAALDDKIELNRRMNETLERQAQAIFRDWFVDFGPVRRKVAGETDAVAIMGGLTPDPADAAKLAALFPDALSDDGLPVGWSETAIGDLVKPQGGSTPSTGDETLWSPPRHCWATPKDLSNMTDLALFDTARQISDAGLAKITSGLLPVGSVLLSSRAPIGYLAIAQAPVAINQGFIGLVPTAEVGSSYLYCWCKANMDKIVANANGSTFQEISKKNFRPITTPVPEDRRLIAEFANVADPLFARLIAGASENRTLAETRDYLLPRLMSGRVRVRVRPEIEAA